MTKAPVFHAHVGGQDHTGRQVIQHRLLICLSRQIMLPRQIDLQQQVHHLWRQQVPFDLLQLFGDAVEGDLSLVDHIVINGGCRDELCPDGDIVAGQSVGKPLSR